MASVKRMITAEAPKGAAAWQLCPEAADTATLLWGRANLLRNRLNAATSRDVAMTAAIAFLMGLRTIASERDMPTAAGAVAIDWLRSCTTPRFAVQAMQHAQLLAGHDEGDANV